MGLFQVGEHFTSQGVGEAGPNAGRELIRKTHTEPGVGQQLWQVTGLNVPVPEFLEEPECRVKADGPACGINPSFADDEPGSPDAQQPFANAPEGTAILGHHGGFAQSVGRCMEPVVFGTTLRDEELLEAKHDVGISPVRTPPGPLAVNFHRATTHLKMTLPGGFCGESRLNAEKSQTVQVALREQWRELWRFFSVHVVVFPV
ncbi:hypothetical protein BOO71_0000019 [Deinococcus marmoris]|uniref:Uncharacterized protein n=1 Tax=Deinococcus marmoris TaxID=249408 RepID=A0A1U7P572_9DEIO|nr:hypothetical protein BOO71_0000019 [Deinococcus marmoris]